MSTSSPMMIGGERGQEAEEGSLVAFGNHLLPGFQFKPTDVEILDQYLRNRLISSSSATVASCLIQEFDVYSTEPWNLQFDSFRYQNEEKAMHFFTPRHPTCSGSRKASRTAGCGFWHGKGRDNHIKVGSRLIGHKTQLTFMILKGKDNEKKIKTNWIMHEFRLHSPNNTEEFDGMVLCRIYKKSSNNCCTEGEEEEAEHRLRKRKRVEGHACLMAENDEAGTSGIVYSESSGQHESLLFAPSSSTSGSAPLASTNVSVPVGDQGDDGMVLCKIYKKRSNSRCTKGGEEEANQKLGKRKRVEGHACLMAENDEAGTSGIAYSESSGQQESLLFAPSSSSSGQHEPLLFAPSSSSSTPDALLFSSASSSSSLPEISPSQLCKEPEGLSSSDDLPPPMTLYGIDFSHMSMDELLSRIEKM